MAVSLLLAGLVLFLGMHLVPAMPGLRDGLVLRLGAKGYRVLFAVVALAGFVLIILGMRDRPYVNIWFPPVWTSHMSLTLMPIAMILLAASHGQSSIKRITAHPMLWAVTLWALSHLLANGDLWSMVLFGAFLVFSMVSRWSANRRGAKPVTGRPPLKKEIITIVAGLVAYAVFAVAHPYLFGVPALPGGMGG